MTTTRRRTRCPYCDADVAVTAAGHLYSHGGVGSGACVGTGRKVAEAETPVAPSEPGEGFWFNGIFYPLGG